MVFGPKDHITKGFWAVLSLRVIELPQVRSYILLTVYPYYAN